MIIAKIHRKRMCLQNVEKNRRILCHDNNQTHKANFDEYMLQGDIRWLLLRLISTYLDSYTRSQRHVKASQTMPQK